MPTFPAFEDVEPPPPSRRARLVRAGVVVGLAALVAAGGLGLAGLREDGGPAAVDPAASAPPSEAPRTGPPSGILYIDSERLGVADPDGGRRAQVAQPFPTTQQRFHLAVAPDRSAVVTEDGYLVDLTRPGLTTPRRIVPADVEGFESVPRAAYADGGARLAVQLRRGGRPTVGLLTIATGEVAPLAEGHEPAGDPTTAGAAYAAGVREIPSPVGEEGSFPDADRVERRTAGGAPVVLLTKADFLRRMGIARAVPVEFFGLSWSPDGAHLALVGFAATGEQAAFGPSGRSGVVVVSRTGEVKAVRPYEIRHVALPPVWSPGGDQLLFLDLHVPTRVDVPTTEVLLWTIGPRVGDPQRVVPPQGQQRFAHTDCVWSPDGSRVLCGDHRAWYVMALSGGESAVAESVPARPAAWLPER